MAERRADEAIYLNEDRVSNPPEVFKLICDLIVKSGVSDKGKFLDVGCAAGEQIYYLQKQFPDATFCGLDISAPLVNRARHRNPKSHFTIGSALDAKSFIPAQFDVVYSTGTLSIFDDPEPFIENLLFWASNDGVILVFSLFNEYEILFTTFKNEIPN